MGKKHAPKNGKKKKEKIKPLKEFNGKDAFIFGNGDIFNGDFYSQRKNRTIYMDGSGWYKTLDGHKYDGKWEHNNLVEVNQLDFPYDVMFKGDIQKMILEGSGTYYYNNGEKVAGHIKDNQFFGILLLTDRNEHTWFGSVIEDENDIIFRPTLPYYEYLKHLPSKFPSIVYCPEEE